MSRPRRKPRSSLRYAALVLVVAGAFLVSLVGRHRLGWTLAYFGLLAMITLGDLISFYVRQFDSIVVVLLHAALLAAVIIYRDALRAEDRLVSQP